MVAIPRPRGRPPLPAGAVALICSLRRNGATMRRIARIANVSLGAVHKTLAALPPIK